MIPTVDDLARLAGKYRALAELRRAKLCGEPDPARQVFRELARQHPGALNELDLLPLDEIDARARALEVAANGGPVAPWMAWMHAYHAILRAALLVKRGLAKARDVSDERAETLASRASLEAAFPLDATFVRAVARPPQGRLVEVVWLALSAAFEAPVDSIKDALFPRRRALR